MRKRIQFRANAQQVGQSLVELALSLPFLVVILAGVVEVSNVLVVQSRLQSSARAATGFGASSIPYEAWTENSDWATGMSIVAKNSVTDTLDLATDTWDMWTVKAIVNEDGDGYSQWLAEHPFGSYNVYSAEQWAANENAVKAELLATLAEDGLAINDLEFVATVAHYSADTILGLSVLDNFTNAKSLRALSIMRVERPGRYDLGECVMLPIALHFLNYSLWWEGYDGTNPREPYYAADPVNIYDHDGWDYGMPPWGSMPAYTYANPSGFPLNKPGQTVNDANEVARAKKGRSSGYIFRAKEAEDASTLEDFEGNFSWLSWNGDTSATALLASLTPPGNLSTVPPPPYDDGPGDGMVNYYDPHLPADDTLWPALDSQPWVPNIGDWVQGGTGNTNAIEVRRQLQNYIDEEIKVILPLFDDVEAQGANFNFRIAAWAEVYLRAYKTTANDKRVLIEYVGPAVDCGMPIVDDD